MNTSLTGKNFLDRFSTSVTEHMSGWLKHWFGPGADQRIFGAVTWADVGVALCFVVLVLFVNLVALGYVRGKLHKTAQAPEGEKISHHVFHALGKPLYALIWIYGIYFAATPLLVKGKPDENTSVLREGFDKAFNLAVFAVLFWAFFRFTRVLEARLMVWAARSDSRFDDLFVPLLGKCLRVLLPVLGIIFALPLLNLPPDYAGILGKGTSILLIVAVAVILFQSVNLGEKAVLTKFDVKVSDNLRARKIYTQVHVISKVAYAIIALFTIASVLMLFAEVRQFGASILASAGVIGIVIGFAAQKTISNLFAGFQIAMTQPIRLDDVVIVENEWGRVEEITLTYVIVHIWDDRRLVVPLSYFIEKPFQNWTRASAQLLGSVYLWVDFTLPLDEVRAALKKIIEPHPLWDKRFWNLQVSDATEKTMQLRVLATTADSSKGWDLRCAIREQLIAYVQKNHPNSLPRFRTEIGGPPGGLLLAQPEAGVGQATVPGGRSSVAGREAADDANHAPDSQAQGAG
ncbi:mechanosensitive ion channel family protein [Horticoccus luteus]|uniref:Mechanosensitive ion channel family protein n=1 Tax=Horticoccus luteus TaxID=2862869 RepID=A0A8F9XLI7_9BACT|nr:mechanosensitive ion channel domain-containing protein [Horticoccus luteus]QYM79074.1 mechanosensitive ion channel family protein [Horticoccus luteus]